jgi:hypothetical protein
LEKTATGGIRSLFVHRPEKSLMHPCIDVFVRPRQPSKP